MLALVVAEAHGPAVERHELGVGGGILLSLNANHLALRLFGIRPPLLVPLEPLLWGAGVTVATAVAASLWPAATVAWSNTLTLLKSDRSSG